MADIETFASTPELKMVMMILDKIDVPDSIVRYYDFDGASHAITIRKVGFNPAMALRVLRKYGIEGIKHSAPTLYFWNTSGAAPEACAAFKEHHGHDVFEMVQQAMLGSDDTVH